MARRFFRKLMPNEDTMRGHRVLRIFGKTLLNRRLWQLNRHSTAWGVASGIFWAWIALPVQTLGAVATALVGRGNVPLAAAFTWISNPLTMVPCFLLTYEIGLVATGADRISGFKEQIEIVMAAGFLEGILITGKFLANNLLKLYPMYVGGVIVGLVTGGVSYAVVVLAWRWNVARRWQARHKARRPSDAIAKISRGIAHIARLGRRTA